MQPFGMSIASTSLLHGLDTVATRLKRLRARFAPPGHRDRDAPVLARKRRDVRREVTPSSRARATAVDHKDRMPVPASLIWMLVVVGVDQPPGGLERDVGKAVISMFPVG